MTSKSIDRTATKFVLGFVAVLLTYLIEDAGSWLVSLVGYLIGVVGLVLIADAVLTALRRAYQQSKRRH